MIRVVPLDAGTAGRWFEVGRAPEDPTAALSRLRGMLERPSPLHFRLLAHDDRGVAGRLGGYCTDHGRLAVWSVDYRDGPVPDVADALLDHVVQHAGQARWVEAQPAYDTAHLDAWRAALGRAGLVHVATADVWRREAPAPASEVWTVPSREVPGALEALLAHSLTHTLDRARADEPSSAAEFAAELRRIAGPDADGETWRVLSDEVGPVAYALGAGAHVLELGVAPRARGRGLGRAVLTDLLSRLSTPVTSLIDRDNQPSVALHRKLGFSVVAGPFETWRRHL